MKIKIIIASVVVLAILIIGAGGIDGVKGVLGGGKEILRDSINKNTSTVFDVGRIKSLMKSEAGKINDFEFELRDLKSKITGEKNKVTNLNTEKTEQKKALVIAKGLLEQKKDEYTIANQKFTFAQVESNASWRIGYVETIDNRISLSETLIFNLDVTYKNCRASLLVAKKNLGLKQGLLKQLQAREMNAEIKAKANALSLSLVGLSDSLLSQTALQEAFSNYESKVIKKEFSLDGLDSSTDTVAIPYDTTPVDDSTTIDKIDTVLKK